MFYAGIDIAKNSHVAAISDNNGTTLVEPFSFDNNLLGFTKLLKVLNNYPNEKLLIGLEATAHYGENLIQFLFQNGFKVALLNPLQTAAFRKNNIRKTKTDKIDALIIIKVLLFEDVRIISSRDIDLITLRSLCNQRRNLLTLRTRSKVQFVAYMDQVFPELQSFFKDNLHINTSYTLISQHTSPQEIKQLHLTYLTNLFRKASHGRYAKEEAIVLRQIAKDSVGINNPVICLQARMAIEQIQLFNKQMDIIENEITERINSYTSRIMTIPGIKHITAAMILSVLGDINRFHSSKAIVAYAGLDPVVSQSGNFVAKNTRMSKRGNSMLRYALMLAAHNVVRNSDTFSTFYAKKISEGKSHYSALGHVAGKLIRVIYTLLKNDVDFKK